MAFYLVWVEWYVFEKALSIVEWRLAISIPPAHDDLVQSQGQASGFLFGKSSGVGAIEALAQIGAPDGPSSQV